MRIAYIVPSLANKGPVIVCKDLVTVMTVHGHECVVYYFDDIAELPFACETKRIKTTTSVDFSDFDVVHSHGIRPDLYVFFHKPFRSKTVYVSTLHCFVFEDLASQYNKFISVIMGRMWMFLMKRHDKIAVLSNVALEYYKKIISKKNMYVAYNTRLLESEVQLDDSESQELLKFKENDLMLGVNALLTPIKGVDLILKSMPFMEGIKLWIVGDGKSRVELQGLAKAMKVEERVYFAGYKKDAFRYLSYYDIYVMPSRSEGFPLSLLEAAMYKKKIICSDIPIFREIFSDKEVSFFYLGNTPSFIESVKDALSSDKSGNAYRRYQENYSSEIFYQNYITIYTS